MVRSWLIGSGAKPAQRRSFFKRNGLAGSANLLAKLQDLLVCLISQLNRFPRNQKFVLGDRIGTKLLDVPEDCLRACYGRDKRVRWSLQ